MVQKMTQNKVSSTKSLLKNCWRNLDGYTGLCNRSPFIEGLTFKNTQECVLKHLEILNGNY